MLSNYVIRKGAQMDGSEEKLKGKVLLGSLAPLFFPKTGLWRWVSVRREQRGEEGLLGFAVGHHTHDADH